jgi:hypothetical protein
MIKMDPEKAVEILEDWPITRLEGDKLFFDDISGKMETMKTNSQRMFVASDSIDLEACLIDKFGV